MQSLCPPRCLAPVLIIEKIQERIFIANSQTESALLTNRQATARHETLF